MSEKYYNLYEHIPEDEHAHISNKIWEAFDRAGIKLSQDAELSIRVYDDYADDDNQSEGYLDSMSEGYDTKIDALVDSMKGTGDYKKIPDRY